MRSPHPTHATKEIELKQALRIGMLCCTLVLGGCGATPYTPSPNRPFEAITEFTSKNSLSIVNAQESTDEIDLGANMLGNLKAWTDVAIQIIARELKARGFRIDPDATRSLSLSLTEVRRPVGFTTIETQIDVQVETGDGYSRKYTGRNKSVLFAVIHRQTDGAMMRVVVEILRDPEIVKYLTQ